LKTNVPGKNMHIPNSVQSWRQNI